MRVDPVAAYSAHGLGKKSEAWRAHCNTTVTGEAEEKVGVQIWSRAGPEELSGAGNGLPATGCREEGNLLPISLFTLVLKR